MKVKIANTAFKISKGKRTDEPLTPGQQQRLSALVKSLTQPQATPAAKAVGFHVGTLRRISVRDVAMMAGTMRRIAPREKRA